MATNGKVEVPYGKRNLIFSWALRSQSVADNTSTIEWSLFFDDGTYADKEIEYSVKIEDVIYSNTMILNSLGYIAIAQPGTVYHNADGSGTLNFEFSVRFTLINKTLEGSGSAELPKIERGAKVVWGANFSETENPQMIYSNPSGEKTTTLQACIADLSGTTIYVPYRDIDKNGTEYTFELTPAERTALISAVESGTYLRIRYYVKSVVDGYTYLRSIVKTMTLSDDAKPTVSPVVVDMNNTTIDLTGDVNVMVRYFSTAACQSNAVAKYGATITTQTVRNGSQTETLNSDGLGIVYSVDSPKFEFSVRDSRNNLSLEEVVKPFVEYIIPTCNQEVVFDYTATEVGDTAATARVKIYGNYFNQSFGAKDNELKIEIRHTDNEGNEGEWVELTDGLIPTFDGNTYELEVEVRGLLYDRKYAFQCRATDKLTSATSGEYSTLISPIFDWSEEDFNFNIPINMNGETVLRHNKTANNVVLSASGGHIYIRPGGTDSTLYEIKITPQGNIELTGDIVINGVSLKEKLGI